MDRTFNELLGYFCLDRKKATIDEFFGDLNNFVKDFEVGIIHIVQCTMQLPTYLRTYIRTYVHVFSIIHSRHGMLSVRIIHFLLYSYVLPNTRLILENLSLLFTSLCTLHVHIG